MLNTLFFWRDKAHPPEPLSDNRSPVPAGYFAPASVEVVGHTSTSAISANAVGLLFSAQKPVSAVLPDSSGAVCTTNAAVSGSGAGAYAYPGGMVDCFLKTLANAVKLSKATCCRRVLTLKIRRRRGCVVCGYCLGDHV